jgi:hypothetical protein
MLIRKAQQVGDDTPSTPSLRLTPADPLQFPFDLHEYLERLLDVSLLQDVVPADALRGRV